MIDYGRRWAAGARELIKRKLRFNGPMTTRELANACQMQDNDIAPRMSELEGEGMVYDTGERRASVSGLGRKRKVWALCGEGEGRRHGEWATGVKRPAMIQRKLPL